MSPSKLDYWPYITSLIENVKDDFVFCLNKDLKYVAFNNNHKEIILNSSEKEIQIGDNYFDFQKDSNVEERVKIFKRVLKNNPVSFEEQIIRNGLKLNIETKISPVKDKEDIVGLLVCSTEIDNKSGSEEIWESLLKISEEAHVTQSIDDFVKTIHGILSEVVLAKNFYICLYDESNNQYYFPYFIDEFDSIDTVGIGYTHRKDAGKRLFDLTSTITDYVRRTGKPLRIPNDNVDKLYKSGEIKLWGEASPSWLGVPLILKGKTFGVMAIQSYDIVNAYSKKDEELMVYISDHISEAIENVRAEEEITQQHQMVVKQRDEIEEQRNDLEKQTDLLKVQSQAITDSINYAKKIQSAILPTEELMSQILPEHFVLFKPRDVVSGDFYWIRQIKNCTIIAAVDCTGHGVPGAFMSMLGVAFLNEMVNRSRFDSAGEFLNRMRKKVKDTLKQEGLELEQKDGMDMALVIIDNDSLDLQFAGAFNPLYLIRNKELADDPSICDLASIKSDPYCLLEIKGDRQPIAVFTKEQDFCTHNLKLFKGDTIYLFSDGFMDQMGGPKGKKFMAKKFRNLLLEIQDESLDQQKNILDYTIEDWKGDNNQLDDILVLGIRWN